ncbi:hypothetical protein H310_11750 [Aphanomyces invadans]|uniref:Uncharacterized protein n=1 Tax=Aphanomyces invadans TaxID=157072 RepID=A0A024TJX1_9STRA|nr:hypothetical protein H310_11750 [Aphanomyces invadans]ETV94425.1 hypothetical protein H310_11750 [Aphanomyces invadans]|eukprot:XP_008876740.1 hypothetical protein H310_11750 [Aphanomyces invadans]
MADDFDDWLIQAKHDFMLEPSPEKIDHHQASSPTIQVGDGGIKSSVQLPATISDDTFLDDDDEGVDGSARILPMPSLREPTKLSSNPIAEPFIDQSATETHPIAPPPAPIEVSDTAINLDWKVQTSFDMPDKLCQEIQSVVDAAATRLAAAATSSPPSTDTNMKAMDAAGPSGAPELLLIMEVVIGDGRVENIQVFEHDEPEALAMAFAQQHSLERDVIPTLTAHILEQIRTIRPASEDPPSKLTHRPSARQQVLSQPKHHHSPNTEKERSYNALRDKFGKSVRAASSSAFDLVPSKTTTGILPSSCRSQKGKGRRSHHQPAASERLYALANAQREWRARAQKKREDELNKELADKKLQLAEKTKLLVANRTNGQYRTIGERLHGEAVSEAARRKKLAEARSAEKAQAELAGDDDSGWMCPKCTFLNRHQDSTCQNAVGIGVKPPTPAAAAAPPPPAPTAAAATSSSTTKPSKRRDTPTRVCGQPKPAMFQPTLLSKENKKPVPNEKLVLRRQKHQEVAKTEYNQRHPFAPQVNPTSTDLVKDKRHGIQTHLSLYADAGSRRERQRDHEAAYLAQFPFRPNIGINTFVAPPASQEALVHRLAIEDQEKLAQSRAKLLEKYGAAKDPMTGRPYFVPQTGRRPQFARNDSNLPIGTFLYESRREFDEIHRQLRHADMATLKDHRTQSFVSKTSKMHLKARKAKSFDRIYNLLQQASRPSDTGEKDLSVLDPSRLDIDALSLELGHVALSLFDTCGWVPIPKSTFFECMESTLAKCQHLTHTQVLFFGDEASRAIPSTDERVKAADDQELTLHPKICAKSHQLLANSDRKHIFEHLYSVHATYAAKRKERQVKLDKEHAETCTFRPQLCKQTFHDMYARLPDDGTDDVDPVVLTSARPCARPSVRPIDGDSTK